MKTFFQSILFLTVLTVLVSSSGIFAQEASTGYSEKSEFLNRDAECNGPKQLKYDDGTFENGYGWNTTVTDGRHIMLFTPTSYPFDFNQFCIALTRLAAGTPNLTFDVIVYDNSGTGGAPGTQVATVTGLVASGIPVWPTLAWYDFQLSGVPILASGSYYVGIKWNPTTSTSIFIGADESTSTPLRTGYAWANAGPWETIEFYWPTYRAMGMRVLDAGAPCPVGSATNPNPPHQATNQPITNLQLSWTNPTGGGAALTNEVWFGDNPGSLTMIHSGSLISTINIAGPLTYNKLYYWRVVEKNDTCSGISTTWSFTTVQNPNLAFCDNFNGFNWTPIGPLGETNWSQVTTNNAGGQAAGELRFNYSPSFTGNSSILSSAVTVPANTPLELSFRHFLDWYANPMGTIAVGYTNDGGTNITYLWQQIDPTGNIGPELVTLPVFNAPSNNFQFVISYLNGYSFNLDYWYVDDFCAAIIPVELTSFLASVSSGNVLLNWSTASETNNRGFEVERSMNGEAFASVGFVEGNGTTTLAQNYSFTDKGLANGTYSYRLKQIDFNGTSEYTNVVEVDLTVPVEFALAQNYPNPFNPTTNINYSLAVDSKVTLRIFDILGQEVASLVNSNMAAGSHTVSFNASSLNSGVYFYQIEAKGIDGTNFSSVKKMMLTK